MKILLINNYHFIKGGSETVYLNTGKLLESQGHEVVYFSSKNEKNLLHGKNDLFIESNYTTEKLFIDKVKTIPTFIYSKLAYKNLSKLIEKEKPDIAHLHIFYGVLTSSVLKALKKFKIPTIMSVHEYRLLCPNYTFLDGKNEICEKCANGNKINCITNRCNKNSLSNSLISAIEAYYRDYFFPHLKYINHFIMVSDFIRKKHIEYNEAYLEKSSLIYNFNSTFKINNLSVIEKNCDLIYFGRLSKEKGIFTLIKSIESKPKITLNIVGKGPEEKAINDYIQLNKIRNVSLLGFISGENLWETVKSAKYAVVPSEWYENNPMNVIESLLLGVPVIGANIGGIPEIVKKSHGFLFESNSIHDLGDKIDQALNKNKEEYKLLSSNAISFANQQFAENVHYEKLIKLYSRVIKENKN